MQIYQPKNGYCYNSDTLFLYDFAKQFLKKHYNVLEVGAGCGVLGLLCGREIAFNLTMIEKDSTMAEICKQNLRINKREANLICDDFLTYDFCNADSTRIVFDVILSNPPFYHDGVLKSKNPILFSARYAQNLPFVDFVKKVNSLLKPQGEFIFCYDAKAVSKACNVLESYRISPIHMRFVHPKLDKSATLVLCRAKKNSKSQCVVLPPLFTHCNGEFTDAVQAIYKSANTWSIKC